VRSIPIRTGDEVVVTAGDHRKKTGKVIGVDRKSYKIHVEGITREKAGGKEAGKSECLFPPPGFCFVCLIVCFDGPARLGV
jgi:ribosomal protein L24